MEKKFVPIAIKGEVKDGYVTVVRYDRSFIARIIQNDAAKAYYSEIKNHCLSLGMRSRISWKGDAFYLGRKTFLIAKVRGRTLALYLALDPAAHDEKVYHHLDVSAIKAYENCPMMIRIRSELALRKAKKLIAEIAENAALAPKDREKTDYVAELPYEETDALIVKGLVKEIESVMKAEEAEKAIAEAEKEEEDEEVIFELAEEDEEEGSDAAAKEEAEVAQAEETREELPEEKAEEEEWVDFELADEDDDVEEVIFELAEDGLVREVRYDRSFTARIIQNARAKHYYSALKNHCLSYPLKSRISWKADTFRKGRSAYLMMKVRGKTLALYFALDPKAYDAEVYHQRDVSCYKCYEKCPMMIKVRSDLALRKAKKLIDEMMEKAEFTQNEIETTDYAALYPYEETEPLIERKLIKKIERKLSKEESEKVIEEDLLTTPASEAATEEAEAEEEEEVLFELAEEEAEEEEGEEPSEETEEEPEEVVFDLVEDLSGEMEAYSAIDREGRYVTLKKYVRGFAAKMKQGSVERKDRYAAVKSAILALKNVKVRKSFAGETFMYGRQPLLKSRVRGKTLCLFFALCPEDYPTSVYHQKDRSGVKSFVDTPMMIRVKSDLGLERALRLVAEIAKRFSLGKGTKESFRDEFFFEETAALVEKGLIKTRLVTVPAYEAEEMLRKKEK